MHLQSAHLEVTDVIGDLSSQVIVTQIPGTQHGAVVKRTYQEFGETIDTYHWENIDVFF
jgi:hypothetical protein